MNVLEPARPRDENASENSGRKITNGGKLAIFADTKARQDYFGRFEYVRAPQPGNPEAITICGNWEVENLVTVHIPQLVGVPTYSGTSTGKVRFHRLGVSQLQALWAAWQAACLIDRVIFWAGAFSPRLIRGAGLEPNLSMHAFGAAFDINATENRLGAEPARLGEHGCVRELVELANAHGFFWGGHFKGRLDGMHFELAQS